MSSPPFELRSKTVGEIVQELFVQIYQVPLSELREDLRTVPEVLRIPILLIDLDTEVTMNGMLGFLENSTGLYLVDTIDALETISAHRTAGILRTVHKIMGDHCITVGQLREQGFANVRHHQIISFDQAHGPGLSQMADQIEHEAKKLYIYAAAGEAVFDLLQTYLEGRKGELVAALEAC